MRGIMWFGLLLGVGAIAACETTKVDSPVDTAGDTVADTAQDTVVTDAGDTADSIDVGDYTFCDPDPEEGLPCPSGEFCETTARVCVECVGYAERCTGPGGDREICERPESTGIGVLTGGFYASSPCLGSETCVETSPSRVACEPLVCTPGETTCRDAEVLRCNLTGTAETREQCGAGSACYEGACEPIRHNVMLIFDTSGSMHNYIDPVATGSPVSCQTTGQPCVPDYPACDDPNNPITLFTLAKSVFASSVRDTIGGFSNFALQRFPQVESGRNAANCFLGWYTPVADGRMTGDDDAFETQVGGWFDVARDESIVVPFPIRNTLNNEDELLAWLDFSETLASTDEPCMSDSDCGTGRCGTVGTESRCFYHRNEELQAGGQTPLGKSLFYAGEYFRRSVRVDGKACNSSAQCGASGYQCVDSVCVDPYRNCRDNFIILFTDGKESEYTGVDSFFNPLVQAQRLAFGLECAVDDDCRGGATCQELTPTCPDAQPPGPGAATLRCVGPEQDPSDVAACADSQGFSALSAPNGQGVSIRTTVITVDPQMATSVDATTNRAVAAAGGGAHLDVTAQDPEAFAIALRQAMRRDIKCQPEDL
ncbi:MAG: hypothetical protein ACI9MR_001951 [Myxococcota bacterium]|jgi:hypothetical protein